MNANHTFGAAGHRGNNHALRANQLFGSGGAFPFARAKNQAHQKNRERRKRKGGRHRNAEAYAAGGQRRANQKDGAEKHRDDATGKENSVACIFCFQNK